jgi:two-component system, OmpR family, phosphate regulon response regulator OmpR
VDDDRRIRELLASYLAEQGYRTSVAASAVAARAMLKGLDFDVIILDVMMPGETGVELSAALREQGYAGPILMLSALAESHDRIAGLKAGSDDYLPKPFEPEELLLRLKGLQRRVVTPSVAVTRVRFGDCILNVETGELLRGGERLKITTREHEMLKLLVQSQGRPVSRVALSAPGVSEAARAVDVQINRLRQKIEIDPALPLHLQTVRGEGYVLHAEPVA